MKPGYYLIKHLGYLLPARFDGERWHHEHGSSFAHPEHKNVVGDDKGEPVAIAMSCPTGCTCRPNPDGSITVSCGPQ